MLVLTLVRVWETKQATLLEEEAASLAETKARIAKAEQDRGAAVRAEVEALAKERSDLQQELAASRAAVSQVTASYEAQIARLTALQRRQAELAAAATAQRDAARRQSYGLLEAQLGKLREERDAAQAKLKGTWKGVMGGCVVSVVAAS